MSFRIAKAEPTTKSTSSFMELGLRQQAWLFPTQSRMQIHMKDSHINMVNQSLVAKYQPQSLQSNIGQPNTSFELKQEYKHTCRWPRNRNGISRVNSNDATMLVSKSALERELA